ncbi:low-affinity gluconate transporter [marine gamma proteobacterium HTCC2207]|uniref:Low-affinity gluconate transporter n=1 Tax=gamma proteobacterium HTCC2207 TaxID=314287 RepID=Q1YPB7_9GAMM|nr:low-affinity gluconate transporter [marine gamma proteobacterium HTCC2207] [gamma proteobacterium HTCC2207]
MDLSLFFVAGAGIAMLLLLVVKLRVPAFLALLITSLLVGLSSGLEPQQVIDSIKNGMGGTLGFVAIVVGLGAILGQILESSGGIQRIADSLIQSFGSGKIQWSLGVTGFIVAIPVFFDVAFIILAPLLYGLANRSGRSLLYYAIPLLAGLAITHSFIPPTPGPIAVAELVKADLGWVILFGALAGIPAMIIAGPWFGQFIANRLFVPVPEAHRDQSTAADVSAPSFAWMSSIILLPLVLIMLATTAPFLLVAESPLLTVVSFLGHPFVALTIATILALIIARKKCDLSREALLNIANKGLEPAGVVILITGAGGAFKQVLIDSGVGQMLASVFIEAQFSVFILGFLIAAITRVAQGSATVAMITGAGLMAPILELQPMSAPSLGLLVIAISSGATILSHVNDSGFWLVSRYLGLSEKDTLKTWTVMTTLISLVGLASCLVISLFL